MMSGRRDPTSQKPVPGGARATDPPLVERRDTAHERRVIGGRRNYDPPLTTRDCARILGVSPQHVRSFINHGVMFRSTVVKLTPSYDERLNGKRFIRIYRDDLVTFLTAIHWSHIPTADDFDRLANRANHTN